MPTLLSWVVSCHKLLSWQQICRTQRKRKKFKGKGEGVFLIEALTASDQLTTGRFFFPSRSPNGGAVLIANNWHKLKQENKDFINSSTEIYECATWHHLIKDKTCKNKGSFVDHIHTHTHTKVPHCGDSVLTLGSNLTWLRKAEMYQVEFAQRRAYLKPNKEHHLVFLTRYLFYWVKQIFLSYHNRCLAFVNEFVFINRVPISSHHVHDEISFSSLRQQKPCNWFYFFEMKLGNKVTCWGTKLSRLISCFVRSVVKSNKLLTGSKFT